MLVIPLFVIVVVNETVLELAVDPPPTTVMVGVELYPVPTSVMVKDPVKVPPTPMLVVDPIAAAVVPWLTPTVISPFVNSKLSEIGIKDLDGYILIWLFGTSFSI